MLRNPYHGNPQFGGRDDWSHTWFHGTRGADPDFGTRRRNGYADERISQPPGEREMGGGGWPQPNQLLGVHFSPLHEVAHKFTGSVSSQPGALVHARLRFSNPAVFPTEDHLDIAVANWASRHYPHWHDEKLNGRMGWNYSDQEGTHRDFSRVPEDPGERYRMRQRAQSLLQWHPHMPEILQGFRQHLADQGHHGIVYGNSLEGPYETDAGRGGEHALKYTRKREVIPRGHPYSFSAIAHPDDIEVTHVEHIAPWREEPQGDQRTWEDVSDQDEGDELRDRVLDYHRQHGGELPYRLAGKRRRDELGPVTYSHPEEEPGSHMVWHGSRTAAYEDEPGTRRFFPGDDLTGMPSGGRQIEWVKIRHLKDYREYDHDPETGRSTSLLTWQSSPDHYTPERWEKLRDSVRRGFTEPLKLEYNPETRKAFLGEGNHRLRAAEDVGHEAVPVWGLSSGNAGRFRRARRVPGEPSLLPEEGHGYFPSSFRPSQVVPASWLHPGQQGETCPLCQGAYQRGQAAGHLAQHHPAEWRAAWQQKPEVREQYPELAPKTAAREEAAEEAGFPPIGPEHQHVLGTEIPREGPYAPSEYDHPGDQDSDYGMAGYRYSLRYIPLDSVLPREVSQCPGGRHGAHCYAAERADDLHHDVGPPEYDDEDNLTWQDSDYVKGMVPHAHRLPPLVIHPRGGMFGGGHRTAAWRDAGLTHVPAWVPDDLDVGIHREAAFEEPDLGSFLSDEEMSELIRHRKAIRRGSRDSKCQSMSHHVEQVHGFPAVYGRYDQDPGRLWPGFHAWNELPGGHILDTTADQFGHKENQGVRLVRRGDPDFQRYQPMSDEERGPLQSSYEYRAGLKGREAARDEKPAKSKAQVNYRPATGRKKCGNCTMIRLNAPDFESHGCTLVKGLIDPDAVCDEWSPEEGIEKEAAFEGPEDRLYHGTNAELAEGSIIEPRVPEAGGTGTPYAYLSHDPGRAWTYASSKAFNFGGEASVYEVQPIGKITRDPHGPGSSYRSRSGLTVVRKVSNPPTTPREELGGRTAASDYTGLTKRSGMIYLDLPEGTVQQVPGGVDDHHITICYLGKDVSDEAFAAACRRAEMAAAACPPLSGVLRGLDTFEPSESSKGKIPAFVPAYIPDIGKLRQALEDLSASEHKDFRPHVTLGYYGEDEDLPEPHPAVPVRFSRLHVKRGDEIVSYPLGQPIAAQAARGEPPTEDSWKARRDRVDHFLERQPRETMSIRDKWGPHTPNYVAHGLIADHDGPTRDEHWEHLPDEYVSLRQPIHTHQGFVYPETVRHYLRADDDPDYYDSREYQPGGDDPKIVRHEGVHYLLDGHHRFVKDRLMGHDSMSAKVFDTANPEHKQSNCYECHADEVADDYDHDSGECETCQHHGWYV